MVSVRVVRTVATVICVAGIAGMIVTSILNHNGAAVTFGLVSAVAVVCAMVAKAVAADTERRMGSAAAPSPDGPVPGGAAGPASDGLAELVEGQVQALIAGGAEEAVVRQLVGESVRLGRSLELEEGASRRAVVDGPH
jgi:hypothetical protein